MKTSFAVRKAGVHGAVVAAPVKVNLKIAYRVHYGQSLGIVGANDILGKWDGSRAVKMDWTPGDYWVADIDLDSGKDVQLEYKYIIINPDGRVNHWKPGANCKLDVHATKGTRVLVTDSWDDHGPRQVQVDAQCPEVPHAPHAPPHTHPQSQEACPQGAGSAQHAPQPQATHTAQQTESPTPPTPTSPSPKPMPGLHHEAQLAMGELQEALERQHKTLQCVSDPTSMDVILGDRLLAAANNKAVAMNRALKAVEALPVLPAPSGSKA